MTSEAFFSPIWQQDYESIDWLIAHNCPWGTNVAEEAARSGSQDILQYLIEKGCPYDKDVFEIPSHTQHSSIQTRIQIIDINKQSIMISIHERS